MVFGDVADFEEHRDSLGRQTLFERIGDKGLVNRLVDPRAFGDDGGEQALAPVRRHSSMSANSSRAFSRPASRSGRAAGDRPSGGRCWSGAPRMPGGGEADRAGNSASNIRNSRMCFGSISGRVDPQIGLQRAGHAQHGHLGEVFVGVPAGAASPKQTPAGGRSAGRAQMDAELQEAPAFAVAHGGVGRALEQVQVGDDLAAGSGGIVREGRLGAGAR